MLDPLWHDTDCDAADPDDLGRHIEGRHVVNSDEEASPLRAMAKRAGE
jgi:hypothetical protein